MTEQICRCSGAIFRLPNGNIILSQREDKPDINSPGMAHVFGGSSLPGETSRQTMERELIEETDVDKKYLRQAEFLGTFDEQGRFPPGIHRDDIYIVPCKSEKELKVLEGAGHIVISTQTDLSAIPLTNVARQVLIKAGFIQ